MSYAGAAFLALGFAFVSFIVYYLNSGEQEQGYEYQTHPNGRQRQRPNTTHNGFHKNLRERIRVDDCTICFEPLRMGSPTMLNCNHVFHEECILRWKSESNQRSCPICRSHFTN